MEKVKSLLTSFSISYIFDNESLFNRIRLCPQGIPSGRTTEDMLAEVRKEAFSMRFEKTEKPNANTSIADDEEDELDESSASSTIIGPEAWANWYPQEWVGWVMFGVPSENPSEHWVNMPISNGPTEVEHYFTDTKGNKSSKRPPGRTNQREKVTMESVVTKQKSNELSMKAQQILLQDEELEMTRSARDLVVIERLSKNADTDEKKVSYFINRICAIHLGIFSAALCYAIL